jgi:hypothetical protein
MAAHRDDNQIPLLHHFRWVRLVFVVALSLLGILLPFTGTTQASCGSYVTHHSGKNTSQAAVAHTGSGQMPLTNHSDEPRPCSGPNCSNRPFLPPLPSVPSVRLLGDEASVTTSFTFGAEITFAPLAEGLLPQHPFQHSRSIFHPPRLPFNS